MKTATHKYEGALRTQMTHVRSGQTVVTDAPTDNNGKGEAFSPSDLVASALVSCMLTVIGIQMEQGRLPQAPMQGSVTKIMSTDAPRRIVRLDVELAVGLALNAHDQKLLEATAHSCPVAKSLHPDIELNVRFMYAS